MREKRKRFSSKIDNLLEMPKELSSGTPKITITGFGELIVENYKGILEYEENLVRINTYIGTIIINGFDLNLNQLTEDDIAVKGKIDSIELENMEE